MTKTSHENELNRLNHELIHIAMKWRGANLHSNIEERHRNARTICARLGWYFGPGG